MSVKSCLITKYGIKCLNTSVKYCIQMTFVDTAFFRILCFRVFVFTVSVIDCVHYHGIANN